jgi:hypothetical protein
VFKLFVDTINGNESNIVESGVKHHQTNNDIKTNNPLWQV